jgi:hypothetical protein
MTRPNAATHATVDIDLPIAPAGVPDQQLAARAELRRYRRHLDATAAWLVESVERGCGGSAAYATPFGWWSRPYPETTGYIIPTLLELKAWTPSLDVEQAAARCGHWLVHIQNPEGWWPAGLYHPGRIGRASIFNTAQVLRGLYALHKADRSGMWAESMTRGARWLAARVGADGLWPGGDYHAYVTPTYYTYAAAAMLRVGVAMDDGSVCEKALAVFDALLTRRRCDSSFDGWGFSATAPAFTHTIAYTIQGFLEAADILDAWRPYGDVARRSLEVLWRRAELRGGRLPAAFATGWVPVDKSVCLTGNAQIALCLLDWERREPDLRLVNGAAKLLDVVCASQSLTSLARARRGAVGGSSPLFGRYMRGRYPNWAAKYQADALISIIRRLARES